AVPRSFVATVYREAYGSWSVEGRYATQFSVMSEKYTVDDNIRALAFFKLISYNYALLSSGERGHAKGSINSIHEAALLDLGQFAPDLRTEINSPGFLTLASPYLIPLVASAMFALALHVGPAAYSEVTERGTLTIGNS